MACHEEEGLTDLGGPGGDLLSRVLRQSTIGAEGFHGRVRDGIGCRPLAIITRSSKLSRGFSDPVLLCRVLCVCCVELAATHERSSRSSD